MDVLIKPRLEEEKRKNIQQTKEEATENAITTVKQKIKEQMEAEQAAREAEGKYFHTLKVLHKYSKMPRRCYFFKDILDIFIKIDFNHFSC